MFGLHSGVDGTADNIFSTAVLVISFGPNKTAETFFNSPADLPPFGFPGPGGDDIVCVVSAFGPF